MMEISPWLVYWLMQLDGITKSTNAITIIGSGLFCMLSFFRIGWKVDGYHSGQELLEATAIIHKVMSIVIPIVIVINLFLPNAKTVAAMILIPPIVNNEQVQQIPDDILTFVRSVIKEYTFDDKEKK